ncbi:hypothetical protein Q8A73_004081 [Channa argus]|nr:hypothetical protein Q8A73_004068 [Channa argus]KAK2917330.1 hypothetical protein Q8A73_004076 [Channa argus]KAK2917335.1 hypothetical protein Q8A73_004081 [Channa argus]
MIDVEQQMKDVCFLSTGRPEKLHRPDSAGPGPEPSCVSMKSGWSMEHPLHFRQSTDGIPEKLHRPDSAGPGPEPSCVSIKSGRSIEQPLYFRNCAPVAEMRMCPGDVGPWNVTYGPENVLL